MRFGSDVCCRWIESSAKTETIETRRFFLDKVVILAGGLGTRISEESHLKPKLTIEIGGRPILWHIMKIYSHFGYNDFVECVGYKTERIVNESAAKDPDRWE